MHIVKRNYKNIIYIIFKMNIGIKNYAKLFLNSIKLCWNSDNVKKIFLCCTRNVK